MNARVFVLMIGLLTVQTPAAQDLSETDFLTEFPSVLTASRLQQPLMDAPNSVTVIDRKLIEASGYHSISDLFRLVPGMYVGQEKGWFHNVSRTFADSFSRRMQVLVDGRSIYLPSFGGVRWDALPIAIDDIERIEVVRGPNAASFGANAFTGIINIITRHPDDVTGRMLRVMGGDHDHREAWFRWAGGAEGSSHRVTLGQREDGGLMNQFDDERSNLLSYRGEFKPDAHQTFSLQLGLLDGQRGVDLAWANKALPHQQDVGSQYFQADYELDMESGQHLQAKMYFNRMNTLEDVPTTLSPGSYYEEDLLAERWHAEIQLDSDLSAGLRSALGAFIRRDSVRSTLYWNTPDKISADSWGVFGHLEWRLSDSWLVNAGAFLEDYELVGAHLSPRATLNWQPSPQHSFRLGISKAYRNPVLAETSGYNRIQLLAANGSPLPFSATLVVASGNVQPEEILSREIGYLGLWPEQGVTLDVRLFQERIRNYISAERPTGNLSAGDCPVSSTTLLGASVRDFCNIGGSTQRGVEAQIKFQPSVETQILANYAFLHIDSGFDEKRYSPPHIAGVHLMHRFPGEVEMTLSHYWVSAFSAIGHSGDILPAYKRLDARLAKHFKMAGNRSQIALTWQNLTGPYYEFDEKASNIFDSRAYVQFQTDF